jgi:elongation factor P--(R)-beta-lysine ligase
MEHWRPSASSDTLRARAELLRHMREFFYRRGVLEVDTPALSRHATVDRHIESFSASPHSSPLTPHRFWLHTSPEFAMKRLLAAGSGPIYQLCHVFRAGDAGRLHNPEFMMLEWYRPGWDAFQLMGEVEALVSGLGVGAGQPFPRMSYRDAFHAIAGLDPFEASLTDLQEGLRRFEVAPPEYSVTDGLRERDVWLDLWMGAVVGPRLGLDAPCFVFDFPASQAALARIRSGSPPVAERFELFWKGLELANGFHELTDAEEQQRRFEADRDWRRQHGRTVPPYDVHLIEALASGLPECAGVALGVDRLLMLRLDLPELAPSMAFDSRRA